MAQGEHPSQDGTVFTGLPRRAILAVLALAGLILVIVAPLTFGGAGSAPAARVSATPSAGQGGASCLLGCPSPPAPGGSAGAAVSSSGSSGGGRSTASVTATTPLPATGSGTRLAPSPATQAQTQQATEAPPPLAGVQDQLGSLTAGLPVPPPPVDAALR